MAVQSLRHIKSRIRSIENTRKLTRAMEMISISKLRRSQEAVAGAQAYYARIESLLARVLSASRDFTHPFFKASPDKVDVVLCVITSDTGLCGAYNHSILYVAENFLRSYDKARVRLVTVGKKGYTYFTRLGFTVAHSLVGLHGRYTDAAANSLLQDLTGLFSSGTAGSVYTVSMQPKGISHYKPAVQRFLHIEFPKVQEADCIMEPDVNALLEELLPVYLTSKIRMLLMHAFTAEHQARAISMGEATHNATDLLEGLVLMRNKIRQANITREIIEIISSAEALKG